MKYDICKWCDKKEEEHFSGRCWESQKIPTFKPWPSCLICGKLRSEHKYKEEDLVGLECNRTPSCPNGRIGGKFTIQQYKLDQYLLEKKHRKRQQHSIRKIVKRSKIVEVDKFLRLVDLS